MKRTLQFFVVLVALFFVQSDAFAQSVATTLNNAPGLRLGVWEEFTITTQAGDKADTDVRVRFTFPSITAGNVRLQFQDPETEEYADVEVSAAGVAFLGPEAGFKLANDAVYKFKILFGTSKTYAYALDLVTTGAEPKVVATATGTVEVGGFAEPTLDSSLDQLEDVKKDEERFFNVFVTAGERAGEMVNVRIKLDDPAQRDSIALQYVINPDYVDADANVFSDLVFDENGIATIGPEGGEPLKDTDILFKAVFAADDTYSYQLQLLREDQNIIAQRNESVTVGRTTTGIDDMIGGRRVAVYPTVSEGLVRLDLGNIRNASVLIVDVMGRKALELNKVNGKAEINTQRFARGTYYVKVYAGKDVAISRLIVR